ncbi:MAG: folate family ECF transporter S component [Ruminococcaceae bacterium]|nr:folate family ECF transporter S component [Oscillospiraceae bacterium]
MQDKEVFLLKTNIKKLAISALMTALCIVIGLVCKRFLTFGAIRVTFENLPILLAGYLLGPIYGGAVGIAADLVSAPLSGFGINPVITLGAASVGVIAGLLSGYIMKTNGFLHTLTATLASHAVGSMIIKSLGLLMYGYAWQMLALRIPLYFVIGIAEAYAVYILLKNKRILDLAKEGRK